MIDPVVNVNPEVYKPVRLFEQHLVGGLDADCVGGIPHPLRAQTHDLSLSLFETVELNAARMMTVATLMCNVTRRFCGV